MIADGTLSIKTANNSSQSNITERQTSANMLHVRRLPSRTFLINLKTLTSVKYNSFIEQYLLTSVTTHTTLPRCTPVQYELIYNTLQYSTVQNMSNPSGATLGQAAVEHRVSRRIACVCVCVFKHVPPNFHKNTSLF